MSQIHKLVDLECLTLTHESLWSPRDSQGLHRDSTGTGWGLGVDSFVTMLTKRLIPSPTPVPLQSTWSHFHKDCPTGSPWEYWESQLGEIPWIPSGVPLEGRGSLPVILKKEITHKQELNPHSPKYHVIQITAHNRYTNDP